MARFIDRFRKNDLTPIEEQQFHFFLSYELRNEFLCYVTKVKQFSGKKIISLTFITSRYNCTYLKVTINKTKQNSYIFKRVYEMISCPSYIRGIITSNPSNRKGGGGSGDAKARLKTCAGRCAHHHCYIVWKFRRHMHKIFDRSDANSACRACFSRWNTHGRAWRHRSSCRASSDPFPSSPFFHSEFSFLENRAETPSPLPSR